MAALGVSRNIDHFASQVDAGSQPEMVDIVAKVFDIFLSIVLAAQYSESESGNISHLMSDDQDGLKVDGSPRMT